MTEGNQGFYIVHAVSFFELSAIAETTCTARTGTDGRFSYTLTLLLTRQEATVSVGEIEEIVENHSSEQNKWLNTVSTISKSN